MVADRTGFRFKYGKQKMLPTHMACDCGAKTEFPQFAYSHWNARVLMFCSGCGRKIMIRLGKEVKNGN